MEEPERSAWVEMENGEASRQPSKRSAAVNTASGGDAQLVSHKDMCPQLEELADNDRYPVKEPLVSTKELCKGEYRMTKNKKDQRRREKMVSGMGDSGSSTYQAANDVREHSHRLEPSVLIVDTKKSTGSSEEDALVAEDETGRRGPMKAAMATGSNHHSQGFSIKLVEAEVVCPDEMPVEIPSVDIAIHENEGKRNKYYDGQANDSPGKDGLDNPKPQPDTLIRDKKKRRDNKGAVTHRNTCPSTELLGAGLLEDGRPASGPLLHNGATALMGCSTHSTNGSCIKEKNGPFGNVKGKKFSKEEDEIIKDAVSRYIEINKLGEEGLHMILNCKKYPQIAKTCWTYIASHLPWRSRKAVHHRCSKLFLYVGHKWTPEEIEFVKRYEREHGRHWRRLADILGVHGVQVRHMWRRCKNNYRKGPWSEDECQQLFDMVHKDLQKKAFKKKNDNCMLRENLSWAAMSTEMGTRYEGSLCCKWYYSLSSSMVRQGLWSDIDDYHLIDSLSKLDALCMEDVDWDNLLTNRSGEICRKRWVQMTKHIGGFIERPFIEQVELMSTRYRIDMLEYRERALEKSS